MFIIPEFNALQVGNVETYKGRITCLKDALLILEATRLGILPKIKRRLNDFERKYIVANTIFAWNETECGMKRWTDGKNWLASKVHGSFLVYKELDSKKNIKKNGLIKQSFSLITKQNQKIHLIYYSAMNKEDEEKGKKVKIPSLDPKLKNLNLKSNIYHDSLLYNESKFGSKRTTSPSSSPSTDSLHSYFNQARNETPKTQPQLQTPPTMSSTVGQDSKDSINLKSIQKSPATNLLPKYNSFKLNDSNDEPQAKRKKPSSNYIPIQLNPVVAPPPPPPHQQCQLQQPAIIIPQQHIIMPPQGPHYMVQQVPLPYQVSPHHIPLQVPNQQPPLRHVPPPLIRAKSGQDYSKYYYNPVYDPSHSPTFSTLSQPMKPSSSASSPSTSVRGSIVSLPPASLTPSSNYSAPPSAPGLAYQCTPLASISKKYSYSNNDSDSKALNVLDRSFSVR